MKQSICDICKDLLHIPKTVKFVGVKDLKKGIKLKPYFKSTYNSNLKKTVPEYWAPCDAVYTIQEIYGEVVFYTHGDGSQIYSALKSGFGYCKLID